MTEYTPIQITITRSATGKISVASRHNVRNEHVLSGFGSQTWDRLRILLAYVAAHHDHTPEGWLERGKPDGGTVGEGVRDDPADAVAHGVAGMGKKVPRYVDIVFDGPPSHKSGRFVEVENDEGASISFGEWIHRKDGYWALRIPQLAEAVAKPPRYEYMSRVELADPGYMPSDVGVEVFANDGLVGGLDGWELVSVVPFTRMENQADPQDQASARSQDRTSQSFGMTQYCRLFFKRMVP